MDALICPVEKDTREYYQELDCREAVQRDYEDRCRRAAEHYADEIRSGRGDVTDLIDRAVNSGILEKLVRAALAAPSSDDTDDIKAFADELIDYSKNDWALEITD